MTYEYVCTACEHQWEAEQSISAKPLEKCPSCGKKTAKRQITGGAGFILKGGGWYADGYASGSGGGKSSDSDNKPASTSDSKSESKPDAKSESKPAKADSKSTAAA